MKYIMSLIVENRHGVLSKITQVITGRGYNINTLSVGPSEMNDTSRMILTFDSDKKTIEQIIKQMNRLIDVIKVFMVDNDEKLERELTLARVARRKDNEDSLYRMVQIYDAKVINVTQKSFVIELTGHSEKIDAFIDTIRPYGLQDLMRTGPLALSRFDGKQV